MWGSLLYIFINTCYIFPVLAILVGLKWHFVVVVIYLFLIANNVEYLHILIGCLYFFVQMSIQFLSPMHMLFSPLKNSIKYLKS